MKKICFLIMIVCFALAIACQPTPERDAVAQKNFPHLLALAKKEKSGEETPLREYVKAPIKYDHVIKNEEGSFHLAIHAQVEIPDSDRMPIVRIQATDFSQEMVSTFFDYFCQDKEMYYEASSGQLTRSQIESYIRFLSQEIADMEENGKDDDPYTEQCRADLSYYQSIYADTPEGDEPVRCFGALQNVTEYSPKTHVPVCSYTALRAKTKETMRDNEWYCPSFSVSNRSDLEQAIQIEGEWFFKRTEATMSFYDNRNHACGEQCLRQRIVDLDEKVDVSFTPRQAEKAAVDFLRSVGLEDELGIDSIWLYRNTGEDPNLPSKEETAYEVRLTRIIHGIPCAYDQGQVISDFRDTWQYEVIDLYVDEEGVFHFNWFGPVMETETLLEEVNLLSFEQIMDAFEAHVTHWLLPDANGHIKNGVFASQQYSIDRITLSLQRIIEPNEFETAVLIPVWSFYGSVSERYDDPRQKDLLNWELSASLITINAIDGSIIDLTQGY